jgi:creatinine amidohydrolase/Fe(II)-dependent formamide hydrolase-like protein
VPKDYRFRPKHWKDFVNSGIFGDASLATTEKGVAFLKNWIDDIVMFIENEMQ